MPKVKVVVAVQALAIVFLVALWWQRADLAPPPSQVPEPGAGLPPAAVSSADAARGPLSSAPGNTVERHAAPASLGTGTPAVVLHGALRGLASPPKPDAVRCTARRDDQFRSAQLDDAGHYAIAGLNPGTWTVACEVEGHCKLELAHELTAAPIQRLDLELTAATVLPVFVRTPDGGRLQAALAKASLRSSLQVVATTTPLGSDLAPTENSYVGDFGVGRHRRSGDLNTHTDDKAGDGVLELDQPPPVFATLLLRHLVLAAQRIEPGQTELRFVVDPAAVQQRFAKVRFRVLDETGAPLPKVAVGLETAQGGGDGGKTGVDGLVALQQVMPGLLQMTLHATDREEHVNHLIVPAGADLDLGDLVLHPLRKLTGQVVDSAGQPIAASVRWTNLDLWQPPQPMIDRRSTSADGDGNFQIYGAGPRRYLVRAQAGEGRIGFAVVDARGSLPAAPPQVRVQDCGKVQFVARGEARRTFTVVVRSPAGHPVEVVTIEPRWRTQTATLPTGDYVLEIYADQSTRLRTQPLVVGTTLQRVELP